MKEELVRRLRAKPNRPTVSVPLGNGQEIDTMSLSYSCEDDKLRAEAADRISLLESLLVSASNEDYDNPSLKDKIQDALSR